MHLGRLFPHHGNTDCFVCGDHQTLLLSEDKWVRGLFRLDQCEGAVMSVRDLSLVQTATGS